MTIIMIEELDRELDAIDDYRYTDLSVRKIAQRHGLNGRGHLYWLLEKWNIPRDRQKTRRSAMPKPMIDYEIAEEIRRKYDTGDYTQAELAEEYGFSSQGSVYNIIHRLCYKESPDKVPEPDENGLTPCIHCEILCEDELCDACAQELRAGVRYEGTSERAIELAEASA